MLLSRSLGEVLHVFQPRSLITSALQISRRLYSAEKTCLDDLNTYHRIADDTLDSLAQKLEEVLEAQTAFEDSDVSLSNGVLTVQLVPHGTYVINKQTPNRQIWLSSPISGPKRYEFLRNTWIYKHDGSRMHRLLSDEFSSTLKSPVTFDDCLFSKEDAGGEK